MASNLEKDRPDARLRPLLRPSSIAVIGASARAGRPGNQTVLTPRLLGFEGPIYPITPNCEEINGERCYADISQVPEKIDLAVIAGAAERVPDALRQAIDAGVGGAVVYATMLRDADDGLSPLDEVTQIAANADLPLLGPGTIGFVNYTASLAASWIPPAPRHVRMGSIALIVQSGSTYSYCNLTDPRVRCCLSIHPGQEAVLSTAELLGHVLCLAETKVVGLYLETVCDPERFVAALARADQIGVPVVVLKPGRTGRGADAIATHAGRLAGDDAIFDALFRRHGVVRVETMDEFYSTLVLFSRLETPGPGGLAAVTDSGGQRSVLIDEAERAGLALAQFSPTTRGRLRQILAPDLPDDNPIDMWGGEQNLTEHVETCLDIAIEDPDTALAAVFTEFGASDTDIFVRSFADAGMRAAHKSPKPIVGLTFSARHFYPENIQAMDDAGVVVLDGVRSGVAAIKHLLARRDRTPPAVPEPMTDAMRQALAPLVRAACLGGETEGLAVLTAAGVDVAASETVDGEDAAVAAMARIGAPVALKTAMGHGHKSDLDGVVLSITNESEMRAAYRDMAERLGPSVTVAKMIEGGVEVALGAIGATPFGPAIMVGAGGTLVEVLDDVTFALAPVDAAMARDMIGRTRVADLLEGVRGRPPADMEALVSAMVCLSQLIAAFGEEIAEIDINPVIVAAHGCTAVDAVMRGVEAGTGDADETT
jgi:acyl-CoA synthetase (NDP forming)